MNRYQQYKNQMPLYQIMKDDQVRGYLYGVIHFENSLISDEQLKICTESDRLAVENTNNNQYIMRNDERVLIQAFREKPKVILDMDKEYEKERDMFWYGVRKDSEMYHQNLPKLFRKDISLEQFNHMTRVVSPYAKYINPFNQLRENKWITYLKDALKENTHTVAVGMSHIYPLIKGLEEHGYVIYKWN